MLMIIKVHVPPTRSPLPPVYLHISVVLLSCNGCLLSHSGCVYGAVLFCWLYFVVLCWLKNFGKLDIGWNVPVFLVLCPYPPPQGIPVFPSDRPLSTYTCIMSCVFTPLWFYVPIPLLRVYLYRMDVHILEHYTDLLCTIISGYHLHVWTFVNFI